MQKHTCPPPGSGIKGQRGRASKSSAAGTASPRGLQSEWNATNAWGEARDVGASQPFSPEMEGGRLEMAVVEMQIDNIRRELETQVSRTAQLETILTGIKDEVHQLIELVTWLLHEVLNTPASVDRTPDKGVH